MKKKIPVCLPKLPTATQILPYLEQIDNNRWYTNYGPLSLDFLSRIAELFQVEKSHVICAVNGTILLELCLKAMKIPEGSLCVMPAWTFVATPLAAAGARLVPYFVDVDDKTLTLDPKKLEDDLPFITQTGPIGAVIVVASFGMPVNVKEWDEFTDRTGIPVIIDAAACFDTILQTPEMQVGHTPMMVSLHATKVLGIGEGAILLSRNEHLISDVQVLTQFGFNKGIRDAVSIGTNAKMSEYAAAVGLAALDNWENTRAAWQTMSSQYQDLLDQAGIAHLLRPGWIPCVCNVIFPNQADFISTELEQLNIMTRKWWGEGCHQQTVFKSCTAMFLKNTEYLRRSVLGLPFYIGMSLDDMTYIVGCITEKMQSCNGLQRQSILSHA